jgi:hypothetical protein
LFLFFVPGKLMAALAYRDDKNLARNLLSRPFFCLTPAEPFFRPDRSSTAPSCRVAVKDGRAFRGHPKGLSLTAASTMARWRYRSGRRPCVAAEQVSSPRRSSRFRFPFPQCLQKCGNSNREVHRLSRFSDHQTACSCSLDVQHRFLGRRSRVVHGTAPATGVTVIDLASLLPKKPSVSAQHLSVAFPGQSPTGADASALRTSSLVEKSKADLPALSRRFRSAPDLISISTTSA